MGFIYTLYGELSNIVFEDAEALKQYIQGRLCIDTFEYIQNNVLFLNLGFNERATIKWIEKFFYPKIAACHPRGVYNRLYFIEGQFFSCIFFGHHHWEIKEYEEPECPLWWNDHKPDYLKNFKIKLRKLISRA
ncbi:MAG: hypothetical protein HQK77_14770 [Desulfobacterales bacterium]|nr:hypothetical protein [Desulfobacterales bacterium]